MPVYEYSCSEHGVFEVHKFMCYSAQLEPCPSCMKLGQRIFSPSSIKIVEKKRLPLGTGSAGKIITSNTTGGLDIFIPSYGALEQEEVDYVAAGAIEKERERVKKKGPRSETQARIQAYAELGHKAKRGQRAKTIREAIAETGDRLI